MTSSTGGRAGSGTAGSRPEPPGATAAALPFFFFFFLVGLLLAERTKNAAHDGNDDRVDVGQLHRMPRARWKCP